VSASVVLLQDGQQLGSFRVLNLSTVGALLVGHPPESGSEPLEVLVRLSTGRTVRAEAAIVREDSVESATVFAIAFARVLPQDQDAISNVVLTALEDARDATALLVANAPELWHLLRRELGSLGYPSFAVSGREDAVRFLEAPNVLTVALVEVGANGKEAREVLAYLADKHPRIRRIALAPETRSPPREPLAQEMLANPWTRERLARVLVG
jgi:hypothetical protein